MSHVSGKFVEEMLRALSGENLEIDQDALLEGLPLQAEGLAKHSPLVEWNDFVSLLERLERIVGSPAGLERVGESVGQIRTAPILRRLAGFSASPEALYRATERWFVRRILPDLECRIDTLNDGRIVMICRVPGTQKACPQLLHLATGAMRALPQILGLPDAEVTSDVQPRWGEWIIVPPPSRSVWTRGYQIGRALFSARAAIEQLDEQQRELEESFRKLHGAYADLEESEARFRALAESAVDLMVELAPDGVIRYVSPSARELIGRHPEEALDSNLMSWIHPEDLDTVSTYLEDSFGFDQHWWERPVFRVHHEDGRWIWMEMEAKIYKTRTGEYCACAILRDVSQRVEFEQHDRRYRENLETRVAERTMELERKNRELRELQSLLLDAERLGTARDLAGRVAHSINNPLGALMGQIALMIHETEPPDPRLEHLLELTGRVGQVVRRTLELYREGKINRAPESMESILYDLGMGIAQRADALKVTYEWRVDPTVPELHVDKPLLLAALENMADNALDWMPGGGELEIEAMIDTESRSLRILIADNGPGIPDENKELCFEPFFTTKENGTGLGLAIARGVIQGHEGELSVVDRPGGGALFVIELPLLRAL